MVVESPGGFACLAEKDIPAGQPVLHTYGDLSDAQLLQTYGFVEQLPYEQPNPHNYVLVPYQTLVAACRMVLEGEEVNRGQKRP